MTSILMNCYNCKKYLKEAIDSVYAQTVSGWEIIFIDNCSTDGSKEILENYDEKIKYYKTEKNVSLGEARNFGLQFCKSEYLAFLDTDDAWLPEKLETELELMDKNPNFQMCYSSFLFMNENSIETTKYSVLAESGKIFKHLLKRYEINMQTVLLRNNFNISFNPQMEFSPDYDLFMEIASKKEIGVISTPLIKYRKTSSSLTSKKVSRWWLEMKMTLDRILKNFTELKNSDEVRFAYAKVFYYKAIYLIKEERTKEARDYLKKNRFLDSKYFFLYILSFFPYLWNLAHKLK
jgi:glycosyltransferase involved in cell wall biosynthesis